MRRGQHRAKIVATLGPAGANEATSRARFGVDADAGYDCLLHVHAELGGDAVYAGRDAFPVLRGGRR
jgi:hypothetical protein